ncbi:MAG: hypothetical protein IJS41_03835 [Clostridia bacterium]|nr:hypothetical protein [Clostridia bacterium]
MSEGGIRIEADREDVKKLMSKLKNLEKAPNHLKNAINRTATQALRMIKAGRGQGYTVKAGRFNADIQPIQRANAAHLDATIRSKGRPPTLKNFKTSMPKSGGKADVTKSGLKRLVTAAGGAAFIPSGGPASGLMAQRRTKKRLPIKVLYGNSVPKMVEQIWQGKHGGQGDLEAKAREKLHEEIQKEIAKLA